ncbi:MAG: alkaline phosphatase family protein, partial [Chloroflexota bacterium]
MRWLRLAGWFVVNVALMAGTLLAADRVLDGFRMDGWQTAALSAAALTAVQWALWGPMNTLARRLSSLLFPVLIFILSGLMVLAAIAISNRFGGHARIEGLGTAIWLSVWVTAGMSVISLLFALDDRTGYDLYVLRPLRDVYRNVPKQRAPGVIFLEIDGLSEPILRQALAAGHLPNLARWIREEGYAVTPWEPDLSSQTSASQAGILLGDNTGIPAFRWWDKPSGTLMVSSSIATARELERRLSTGDGLLIHGGASRWNAFSGDAPDTLLTYSTIGDASREPSNAYLAYFANPFTLTRALVFTLADVARERWQAWRQARQNVLPRVHRGWKYAFTRAGTTSLMQEASKFIVASDMLRGVPSAYVTFFGYDEVAHHSGIDRPDVWGVLRNLDRDFGWLKDVSREAARPYEIVVLSDHGQSMGATFLQRYGVSLADLVRELLTPGAKVTALLDEAETAGYVNVAVGQAMADDSRTAGLLRRVVRGRTRDGEPAIGENPVVTGPKNTTAESDAVVLASGNLGVISFPREAKRLTLEEMAGLYPLLVKRLVEHPGISLALVETGTAGPVAIGKAGIHYLEDGRVEGEDPLAPFGETAARHLLRESRFENCPDIVVISEFDPETREVAAFEELVGNHGGLGGWQQRPFVLHPPRFQPPASAIVGTGELHRLFKGWVDSVQGEDPAGATVV